MLLANSVVERKPRHGQEVSRSMKFCFPKVPFCFPIVLFCFPIWVFVLPTVWLLLPDTFWCTFFFLLKTVGFEHFLC